MEIGNEISQKIRSAIKAKLVDLGAYVDDELPDYIMVMVANRKNVAQMTEDLNLFLGSNTENFTTWLSGLLSKLQSITADSPKPATGPSESVKSDPKLQDTGTEAVPPNTGEVFLAEDKAKEKPSRRPSEKSRKHSADRLPQPSVDKSKASSSKSSDAPQKDPGTVPTVEEKTNTSPKKPSGKSSDASKETATVGTKESSPAEEVELLLKPEDDFEEEMHAEVKMTQMKTKKKESNRKPSSSHSSSKVVPSSERSVDKDRHREDDRGRHKASSPQKQTLASSGSRKRRGPSSAVGAVVTHDVYDSYQYDPYHPAVGTVASVVKVTDRKSSVPAALQANRSLLLKAMNEAHTSIERHTKKMTEAVHTVMKKSSSASKPRSLHSRLGSSRAPPSKPRKFYTDTSPCSVSTQKPREERTIQLFSRSKREEVLRQFKSGLDTDETEAGRRSDNSKTESDQDESDSTSKELDQDDNGLIAVETAAKAGEDGRLIEVQEPDRSSVEESEELAEEGASRQTSASPLSLSASDSQPPSVSSPVETSPASPKFVVTLDGVEPALLQKKIAFDTDDALLFEEAEDADVLEVDDTKTEEAPGRVQASNVVKVRPQLQAYQQPQPGYRQHMQPQHYQQQAPAYQHQAPAYQHQAPAYQHQSQQEEQFYQQQYHPHPHPPHRHHQQQQQQQQAQQQQQSILIPPVTINLADEQDDEGDEEFSTEHSPVKKAKPTERCHFWPNCKNGDSCVYHHPSSPCRFFPKCQYGEKCMYIHPSCKYDGSCTRPSCVYQHSSRKSAASASQIPIIVLPISVPMYQMAKPVYPVQPQPSEARTRPSHPSQITCRFFPKCTNMSCPYSHPRPCRYGLSCSFKSSCPYMHPDTPAKDQLRWVAGKSSSVESGPSVSTPETSRSTSTSSS